MALIICIHKCRLCVCAKSLQSCQLFATLWTVAYQAPLSVGFSRQEYWSGLPCPLPGDLPNPENETSPLASHALYICVCICTWHTWQYKETWRCGGEARRLLVGRPCSQEEPGPAQGEHPRETTWEAWRLPMIEMGEQHSVITERGLRSGGKGGNNWETPSGLSGVLRLILNLRRSQQIALKWEQSKDMTARGQTRPTGC